MDIRRCSSAGRLSALGRSRALYTLLAVGLALTVGCAPGYTVPPVNTSPTGERHAGKFVWHDLLTHDAEAASRFYSELFGWEVESRVSDNGSPFLDISLRGRSIGSMVEVESAEVSRARWVAYISVPDVDAAARIIEGQGGEIIAEPRDLDSRGRIAVARDTQGAVFGLLASTSGDPPDLQTPPGGFLWNELWTDDVQRSVDFYHAVAGHTHVVVDFPTGGDYDVLQAEDRPRGGIVRLPFDEVRPNWLPYVLVDDPISIVGRVEELGGKVLLAPHQELRAGSVAIIADPSGAALTIQRWPIEGEGRGAFPQ